MAKRPKYTKQECKRVRTLFYKFTEAFRIQHNIELKWMQRQLLGAGWDISLDKDNEIIVKFEAEPYLLYKMFLYYWARERAEKIHFYLGRVSEYKRNKKWIVTKTIDRSDIAYNEAITYVSNNIKETKGEILTLEKEISRLTQNLYDDIANSCHLYGSNQLTCRTSSHDHKRKKREIASKSYERYYLQKLVYILNEFLGILSRKESSPTIIMDMFTNGLVCKNDAFLDPAIKALAKK